MNNTLTQQLKDSFTYYTKLEATVFYGNAILLKYSPDNYNYFASGKLETNDENYWTTVCSVIARLWYDTDTDFKNLV